MHGKTIRRRRAVLVLLVALSLVLLTAYFEESPSGGLHSVQRGFLTVISPIQNGANKALKPVRDMFGWFGETLHAKSQRNQLRKQLSQVRAKLIAIESEGHEARELRALFHMDQLPSLSGYGKVSATVVDQSPNIWYSTVTIDKGTSSGVQVEDPVINGEALVGEVTLAASDGAVVSLITDSGIAVSARVNATGAPGILEPKVGDPDDLLLRYLPTNADVVKGDYIVTSGTLAPPDNSLFPKAIPIGQVSSVNEESPYEVVNVTPLANLHNLDVVQVLTHSPGSAAAQLGKLAAKLPPGTGDSNGEEAPGSGAQLAQAGSGG